MTGSAHLKWVKRGGVAMARCEVCGNDYDKTFEVITGGAHHVFDSFECAIHALAPTCQHCGCRVIGHGVEDRSAMYCCARCALASGVEGVRDRVDA
jgi:hypothetical protein